MEPLPYRSDPCKATIIRKLTQKRPDNIEYFIEIKI